MDNIEKKGRQTLASVWPVSRETFIRFEQYVEMLRQWQPRINLVAQSTMEDIWVRHLADSAQSFAVLPKARHWIDIGSGAGFPGLLIAIILAEQGIGRVDLIESNGKKCAFLNAVIRKTEIRETGTEVFVHQGRIENELPKLDRPDVITARALAPLKDLLRLTDPYLQDKCVGLFAKGRDHQNDIELARENWNFDNSSVDSQFSDGSVLMSITNVSKR